MPFYSSFKETSQKLGGLKFYVNVLQALFKSFTPIQIIFILININIININYVNHTNFINNQYLLKNNSDALSWDKKNANKINRSYTKVTNIHFCSIVH